MTVEYPSDLLRHPLTLVMAYYRFVGAKHSVDEYTDWLGRFLGVSDQPMLVATSPDLFVFLAGVRYARCTTEEQRKGWAPDMVRQIEAEVSLSQMDRAGQGRAARHGARIRALKQMDRADGAARAADVCSWDCC